MKSLNDTYCSIPNLVQIIGGDVKKAVKKDTRTAR